MEFIIKAQEKPREVMNRIEQKASIIGGKMNQSFNKAAEKTGTIFERIGGESQQAAEKVGRSWQHASRSQSGIYLCKSDKKFEFRK